MVAEAQSLQAPHLTPPPSLLIVAAPYYRQIADWLLEGAQRALNEAGAKVEMVEVPGALEIPVAIGLAARARRHEGYVALGCVIRGETTHYETVCNDSSHGLMRLGCDRGLCIGNGILTVENRAQAEERADPARLNKGGGAAEAALHLIGLARRFNPPAGPERPLQEDEILLAGAPGSGRIA